MINETVQVVADPVNWQKWAFFLGMLGFMVTISGILVRVTRNHTKLEEGHKNHVESTKDKFSAVHHRIDEKADKEVVENIDKKLDLIINKLM